MSKVTKIKASENLISDIKKLIKPIVGDISDLIKSGDRVLIKPNFNTADEFPASTSLDFLEAVIKLVSKANPKEIIVGESCTYFLKTEKVCQQKNALDLIKNLGAKWYNFDLNPWVKVDIPGGKFFKSIKIPLLIEEVDKIIFLPCLKTHRYAHFTISLKITIGMLKSIQRGALHLSNLEERVSEVASVFKPDLTIVDGRKSFTTLGPEKGQVECPQVLMAAKDRIALDIEGLKILKSYNADNLLVEDPWQEKQITKAIELGLGARSEDDYELINVKN